MERTRPKTGLWSRWSAALSRVEAAMDHQPIDYVADRLRQIEARIAQLEAAAPQLNGPQLKRSA